MISTLQLPWPLVSSPLPTRDPTFTYIYLLPAVVVLAAMLSLRLVLRRPATPRRVRLFWGISAILSFAGYVCLANVNTLSRPEDAPSGPLRSPSLFVDALCAGALDFAQSILDQERLSESHAARAVDCVFHPFPSAPYVADHDRHVGLLLDALYPASDVRVPVADLTTQAALLEDLFREHRWRELAILKRRGLDITAEIRQTGHPPWYRGLKFGGLAIGQEEVRHLSSLGLTAEAINRVRGEPLHPTGE